MVHKWRQVRKLLLVGYDVRKITGDDISREEYDAEHKKVGVLMHWLHESNM